MPTAMALASSAHELCLIWTLFSVVDILFTIEIMIFAGSASSVLRMSGGFAFQDEAYDTTDLAQISCPHVVAF